MDVWNQDQLELEDRFRLYNNDISVSESDPDAATPQL